MADITHMADPRIGSRWVWAAAVTPFRHPRDAGWRRFVDRDRHAYTSRSICSAGSFPSVCQHSGEPSQRENPGVGWPLRTVQ